MLRKKFDKRARDKSLNDIQLHDNKCTRVGGPNKGQEDPDGSWHKDDETVPFF